VLIILSSMSTLAALRLPTIVLILCVASAIALGFLEGTTVSILCRSCTGILEQVHSFVPQQTASSPERSGCRGSVSGSYISGRSLVPPRAPQQPLRLRL